MMQAMRIVTAVVLLSLPAFALDLTLGEKVEGNKTMQSWDKVDTLRLTTPNGLTWSAKYVRSVSALIDEKSRTLRSVHVDFGARFKTWDDVLNRVDELSKQIGAADEARAKWERKFRGKPELGTQRWFPNYVLGGCEVATITINPFRDRGDWSVSLEFLLLSPEEWARNPSRPATCPATTSR
ncbi:MAG: hypothetical protein ACO1OB_29205 [Archangium sp.]